MPTKYTFAIPLADLPTLRDLAMVAGVYPEFSIDVEVGEPFPLDPRDTTVFPPRRIVVTPSDLVDWLAALPPQPKGTLTRTLTANASHRDVDLMAAVARLTGRSCTLLDALILALDGVDPRAPTYGGAGVDFRVTV